MHRVLQVVGLLTVAGLLGGIMYAAAAPAPAAQEVKVGMKEWAFEPTEVIVKPGKVRFVLKNDGRRQHNFAILGPGSGNDVNVTSDNVGSGAILNFDADLSREGTYLIYCDIEGHRERGMEGRLAVRR